MEYYTDTLNNITTVIATIDSNCGWPNANVTTWATPRETATTGVYVIPVPKGSHGFTYDEMNAGISCEITTTVVFPEVEEV